MEVGIIYNLVQLIRQDNSVYFLAYKLFFIVFLGCWFIYLDLDIFCLILWMVYGSFIAMVFMFLLMWTDVTRAEHSLGLGRNFIWGGFVVIFVGIAVITGSSGWDNWLFSPLAHIRRMNFYEQLHMDVEMELEVLGWGFGFENLGGLVLGAVFLTIACFTLVTIILNARRYRWLTLDSSLLAAHIDERHYKFLTLKLQNITAQERGAVGPSPRIFKCCHTRRI